jgi:6,7-dimethyl-8-ribityllumazine synthase
MGITGPGMSQEQAVAREEYGATAVESAIEMVAELDTI